MSIHKIIAVLGAIGYLALAYYVIWDNALNLANGELSQGRFIAPMIMGGVVAIGLVVYVFTMEKDQKKEEENKMAGDQ